MEQRKLGEKGEADCDRAEGMPSKKAASAIVQTARGRCHFFHRQGKRPNLQKRDRRSQRRNRKQQEKSAPSLNRQHLFEKQR